MKTKKLYLIPIVFLLLLFVVMLFQKKQTINLNDYLLVEYSGYDGYGVFTKLELDEEKIREDFDLKYAKKDMGVMSLFSPEATMASLVSFEVDKADGLSNGDVVPIKISCLDSIHELFNIGVKYSDFEVKIEGLDEITYYDPFEKLKITFSGTSNYVDYEIDTSQAEIPTLRYFINREDLENAKNGDMVKVIIKDNIDPAYFMRAYGMVPECKEKEVAVTGVSTPVTEFSQLSDENMEYLKTTTENMIAEKFSNKFDIKASAFVDAVNVYSYVFETKVVNKIYVLYQLDVVNKSDEASGSVLFAGVFEDVYTDGSQINLDLLQSKYVGAYHVNVGNYPFPGYDSYNSFLEKSVNKNVDGKETHAVSLHSGIIK